MRKENFLIILCLFIAAVGNTQTVQLSHNDSVLLKDYIKEYIDEERKMQSNTNYISQKTFNTLIQQVFSKVVIKSEDIVKNGTASNISIKDDKSVISGNASFKGFKNSFWNFGLAGKTEGKTLSIFQSNGYSKGFTISAGIDFRTNSSIFYDGDSSITLSKLRQINNLKELQKIRNHLFIRVGDLRDRIQLLEGELQLDSSLLISNASGKTKLDFDFEAKGKQLQNMKDSLSYYVSIYKVDSTDRKSFIENEISNFELKQVKIVKYTLHWLSFNVSFSNQGYNIFDSSISARLQKDTLNRSYFQLFSFNPTYNYVRNTNRLLLFAYAGFSAQNQYALQDLKIKNETVTGAPSVIFEKNGTEALNVSEISNSYNKSYFSISPQAGGFLFFGKSKIVGIEAFASVNIKANVPDFLEYKPSYTFRFGPLFSLARDKSPLSDGTIGLMLTATNYLPSQKFTDVFGFGFRLGIPFNKVNL